MSSKGQPSRGDRRRQEILEAALACFLEKGVSGTTLGDIRARSGASTGSIYHLFPSKEAIAGALLLESLRDLHGGIVDAMARAETAEASVRRAVERYVAWVAAEPDRARFLLTAWQSLSAGAVSAELLAENKAFLSSVKVQVGAHVRTGEIRAMPMDVFVAVVLGPMQEWARQWLAGIAKTRPSVAGRDLGTAAWNALRSR